MKKIFAIFFLGFLILPGLAAAASILTPYWGPIVSCSGAPAPDSQLPQCKSFCDVLATGQNIIKMALTIALYVIAPILFLWGGVLIMTAGGSLERVKKARDMLWSVAVGIGIVLAAFVIVNTFFWAFNITFVGPGGTQTQSSWTEIKCEVQEQKTTQETPSASTASDGGGGPLVKYYSCTNPSGQAMPGADGADCYQSSSCMNGLLGGCGGNSTCKESAICEARQIKCGPKSNGSKGYCDPGTCQINPNATGDTDAYRCSISTASSKFTLVKDVNLFPGEAPFSSYADCEAQCQTRSEQNYDGSPAACTNTPGDYRCVITSQVTKTCYRNQSDCQNSRGNGMSCRVVNTDQASVCSGGIK